MPSHKFVNVSGHVGRVGRCLAAVRTYNYGSVTTTREGLAAEGGPWLYQTRVTTQLKARDGKSPMQHRNAARVLFLIHGVTHDERNDTTTN